MEGTWAPWTYHDEDDNLVGYDVEVAQQIAEKLGVKATFVEGEWDGLLAGIDSRPVRYHGKRRRYHRGAR